MLGPGAGIAVGLFAVVLLRFARQTIGVRRDYESIYSLGVCFSAFAAAEALHGSGFLASFAAGAIIAALDDDLCDCFVEYGETTAEMLLMFTFVLLGASLIWLGFGTLTLGVAAFVLLALMTRPVSLLLALAKEKLDHNSRSLITWFGPRGLSTLLLALIPAFDGVPNAEKLFGICGLVVLLSIVVHGGSIGFLAKIKPATYKSNLRMSVKPDSESDVLIQVSDVGPHMRLADVRSERSFSESSHDLKGAVRLNPERPVDGVKRHGFAADDWIALFCT